MGERLTQGLPLPQELETQFVTIWLENVCSSCHCRPTTPPSAQSLRLITLGRLMGLRAWQKLSLTICCQHAHPPKEKMQTPVPAECFALLHTVCPCVCVCVCQRGGNRLVCGWAELGKVHQGVHWHHIMFIRAFIYFNETMETMYVCYCRKELSW